MSSHERPQFGLELPTEPLRRSAEGLYNGLRNTKDTVTWRTLAIKAREVLGSPNPEKFPATASIEDAEKFVKLFTKDTYMQHLTPEILYALGYQEINPPIEMLDTLIVSARHSPDELVSKLADELIMNEKKVGVIIPVGHYADKEPRIVGPRKYFHDIDTAVFLTSTQSMKGGSMSVLVETLNLLRNPDFASHVNKVAIVIPMFGGSRGHKVGQAFEIGDEILQAKTIPNRLSVVTNDILAELGKNAPEISFLSVDIHNEQLPRDVFNARGFEFTSVGPEREFASALKREIEEQGLHGIPVRVIAVDKGAALRTENVGVELLRLGANGHNYLDVVQIEKIRNSAGEVESARIVSVKRLSVKNGELIKTNLDVEEMDREGRFVRVTTDDMLDSGRSAKKDDELLDRVMPNSVFKISIVTHNVTSEGVRSALDNTGSDVVIMGNTLPSSGLNDNRIRIVDLAPAISRTIHKKSS